MRGCQITFVRVFLVCFGLVFLAIGIGIATVGAGQARAAAERAERLEPLGAAALGDSQPGREVLVEGRVSARNPALFRHFVAYQRHEYHGSTEDGDPIWRMDEQRTPPLLLELDGGGIMLADDQYRIDSPGQIWEEPGARSWNSATGEGTKRYRGFAAGDPVVAIGVLVPGREGLELRTEALDFGTRADYIAYHRGSANFLPWFGGLFALIGTLLAGIGAWRILRG